MESFAELLRTRKPEIYRSLAKVAKRQGLSLSECLLRYVSDSGAGEEHIATYIAHDPELGGRELEELRSIIEGSEDLREIAKGYKTVGTLMSQRERERGAASVAARIYEHLDDEQRRKFTPKALEYYIRRLNLGLIMIGDTVSEVNEDEENSVESALGMFDFDEELQAEVLSRHYAEKLERAKTPEEAREILERLGGTHDLDAHKNQRGGEPNGE